MEKCDFGLIGLAVMGQNLVLNMDDHGFKVAVFNRTVARVDEFLNGKAKGTQVVGTKSVEELVSLLNRPRQVMLLVKAGKPVDDFIDLLIPHLDKGDIIIDGGNSNYNDTIRRTEYVESKGLLYIGTGVSGGEEGARFGPSIMPGGSPEAWLHVKDIFQAISAKVDGGVPCCDWVGENGAGHYVKMTHNGIEYGDMQLICEAYDLMKNFLGMDNQEMQEVFTNWNEGKLDSYLIEITRDILGYTDNNGEYVIDKILDTAGQKGTGKWTAISSLEMGVPLTLITEAVLSRFLSSLKGNRVEASKILTGSVSSFEGDKLAFIQDIHDALYASKIMSYTQGYMLMRSAAVEYKWDLNYGGIALMWRGGCIIRSAFLSKIKDAFDKKPDLNNLLLDDYFKAEVDASQAG
ncbi:MAG: decarboxylating NADP(+)-dependent phosphogluconate dehydrogenase, partial [Anaerolineales bacterium]|nr:decarboxylating NADP(+)-dependent phosphogluconate dehydrogenase [Anaerolineales bacterium]